MNGKDFGRHPIGRTTLTLDVTDELKQGVNSLEVKAEHPEMIADMPWVCGGCSSEWGFSEGSQPLGIFRPVVLEVTDEIRIEPFGVHIWNDEKAANVFVETEVKNYSKTTETVELVNKLSNADGKQVFRLVEKVTLAPGEMKVIRQQAPVENPVLWNTENPYLYKLILETENEVIVDHIALRKIEIKDQVIYLNGQKIKFRGVNRHDSDPVTGFTINTEQITTDLTLMKQHNFNAIRSSHYPNAPFFL